MTNKARKRPRSSAEWLFLDSFLKNKEAHGMSNEHADKIRLAWRNWEGSAIDILRTVGLLYEYHAWWVEKALKGEHPWEKNSVESES